MLSNAFESLAEQGDTLGIQRLMGGVDKLSLFWYGHLKSKAISG